MRFLFLTLAFMAGTAQSAQQLDRKCFQSDCLTLAVEKGIVFGQHTGPQVGKLKIGEFDARGIGFVPTTEAPIQYSRTERGWVAVVAARVPKDFILWPELRLYLIDPAGHQRSQEDLYTLLHDFRVGRILNTRTELAEVSTVGDHSYVVRTLIWLLPEVNSRPKLLLHGEGLLNRIQPVTASGREPGFWIDRETYDGIHAETKGWKPEFWAWDEDHKILTLRPAGPENAGVPSNRQ